MTIDTKALPPGEAYMVKNAGLLVPRSGSHVSPVMAMAQFLDVSTEKAADFISVPERMDALNLEIVKVKLVEADSN